MRNRRPAIRSAPNEVEVRTTSPTHGYTLKDRHFHLLLLLLPSILHPPKMSAAANRMAAKVAESATKAAGKATQSGSTGGAKKGQQTVLQKGARRDPELYVWKIIRLTRCDLTHAFSDPSYHYDRGIRSRWLSLRCATSIIKFVVIMSALNRVALSQVGNPRHLLQRLQSVWPKGRCLGKRQAKKEIKTSISSTNITLAETQIRRPRMPRVHCIVSSFPMSLSQRCVVRKS